jgi:hypothetical protein
MHGAMPKAASRPRRGRRRRAEAAEAEGGEQKPPRPKAASRSRRGRRRQAEATEAEGGGAKGVAHPVLQESGAVFQPNDRSKLVKTWILVKFVQIAP